MADIRKRTGNKGTTYQVRYPDPSSKSGYSYATFDTRKEALEFRDSSATQKPNASRASDIRTVEQALQKWLDICEKEGRDGRDPVTGYTLKNYQWRRDHIVSYGWSKPLAELTTPDVVEFRSWLLRNHIAPVARMRLVAPDILPRYLMARFPLGREWLRMCSSAPVLRLTSRSFADKGFPSTITAPVLSGRAAGSRPSPRQGWRGGIPHFRSLRSLQAG